MPNKPKVVSAEELVRSVFADMDFEFIDIDCRDATVRNLAESIQQRDAALIAEAKREEQERIIAQLKRRYELFEEPLSPEEKGATDELDIAMDHIRALHRAPGLASD